MTTLFNDVYKLVLKYDKQSKEEKKKEKPRIT